jgi:hypothetical protein
MAITEKQLATLNDKQTIVIVPAEGVEGQLAQEFLKGMAPKVVSELRMFQELHLLALQGSVKVCFVYRNPSTPCYEQFVRPDGLMGSKLRAKKDLMDEMIVTQGIEPEFVREHPLKPAILNISGFLDSTAKLLAPYIRLDYVDKGEVRPQVLRLSWT